MIDIKNINKSYGNLQVLKNVSITIDKGDIYGLIGRSGAGKSTLLRCINRLEHFDEGQITIDGIDIKSLSRGTLREFRKNIGMIFQHFSLIERKTVYENIALPMKCWKIPKNQIDKKVNELVQLVDIEDKINVKAKNLSGGQKQRVAIARALTLNPKILLCDEATSALDPKTTKDILSLLQKINTDLSITIVVVTHQMSVVRQICNKMAILQGGEILECGQVDDIFLRQPEPLKNLLGEESINPPDTGSYIEFFMIPGHENLLSTMAWELGEKFSLVSGNIEKYRENSYGHFVIHVDISSVNKYEMWLKNHGVRYRVIGNSDEVIINA
ncbi:MAG: transporter ATP-binding protein [Clostridiales bacterium]|jgi:D-methionine transport system ATP-binding protein|nr:transporter ATP-binding protein [Clostridiales bacterium]